MKRLLMMILVLALTMPCLAETADAGQRVAAPIDAAETAPESTEEAPPVYAEETMPAADEVAPAAEEAAPIEAVMPVEDAEIIAAPVDADVPEAAAELGDETCVAFEAFETSGEMTWAYVRDELISGRDVTLTNDVTRGDNDDTILVNDICTLDLNGHTLSNGTNDNAAISVSNEGNALTIKDSSTGKTGKILYGGNGEGFIIIMDKASLTLEGGTIALNNTENNKCVGITNESVFNMKGVSITGFNQFAVLLSANSSCRFTMSGGTISACKYGIWCDDGVEFTMSSGKITGCSFGVSLTGTSAMTMTGGAITQNREQGVGVDADATRRVCGGNGQLHPHRGRS